ncbi:MAG: hypothetical protein HOW73_34455, partial [Polyangiaceae bacterium]|nr:hypothetical protein [Polyangiaceae bacterium]
MTRIGLRSALGCLTVGLTAGAVTKAPDLVRHLGATWPSYLPEARNLPELAAMVGAGLGVTIVTACVVQYVRVRTRPQVLARSLDKQHATDDLFVTALSIEREGDAPTGKLGGPEIAKAVVQRAQSLAASITPPIPHHRRSWAFGISTWAVAILAGVVLFLPKSVLPKDLLAPADVAPSATQKESTPTLSKEDKARIEQLEKQLQTLEEQRGLSDSAKKKLGEAQKELRSARKNSSKSAGHLSAAARALQDLANEAREQGGLFDQPSLESLPLETVTKQLADAIERGDADTASAMANELNRRSKDANDYGLKSMGQELSKALKEAKPAPESGVDPKDAERWKQLAKSAGERFDNGEPSSAKKNLRELVEDMDQKRQHSVDQALSNLGDVRSKQLETMNQQRGVPPQGQQGQQGANGKQAQNGQQG